MTTIGVRVQRRFGDGPRTDRTASKSPVPTVGLKSGLAQIRRRNNIADLSEHARSPIREHNHHRRSITGLFGDVKEASDTLGGKFGGARDLETARR